MELTAKQWEIAGHLSFLKVIFLTPTDANHRDSDSSLETCVILYNISPGSYLASAHCVFQGMYYCLLVFSTFFFLSCLPSHRLATKFSGLNVTEICQHQLTDYTLVAIPKSKLILRNQNRVKVKDRNCSVRAKRPG